MAGDRHIRFADDIDGQIQLMSEKTGDSFNETVRKLVSKGLGVVWNDENSDLLAKLIRDSLEVVIKPHVERLAALNSKTLHMASTSTFLLVQTLQDLVPVDKRKDVRPLYEKARKMAVEYARTKAEDFNINEQGNS